MRHSIPSPSGSWRPQRAFGLGVGAALVLLGALWLYRSAHPTPASVLLGLGAALFALGAAHPRFLVRPHRLWTAGAEAISWVMTRVILGIVFLLLVTPIGIFVRLTGYDPLRRRGGPSGSYWVPYPRRQADPKHYEKMF